MPVEEQLDSNSIDAFLATSEAFHGISLSEPMYPEDTNYRSFQNIIDSFIIEQISDQEDPGTLKARFWREAFNEFVCNRPHLEREAKSIYGYKEEWKITKTRWTTERNTRSHVGRSYIAKRLNADYSRIGSYIEEFKNYILVELEKTDVFRRNKKPRKEVLPKTIRTNRRPWTFEEDVILVKWKRLERTWSTISELLDTGRTNVDCKDRWRNLIIKYSMNKYGVFL
jgi:Myb-like DNA-binding domain